MGNGGQPLEPFDLDVEFLQGVADLAGRQVEQAGGLYKSFLLEHAGTYYLFYNAKDKDAWPWREQTGVATSKDLVHWTRHPANPLIPNGPAGSFDDVFASDPCVLRLGDAGPWAMFYFGLSSDGHARESVAFSDDLVKWKKSDEILVDVGGPGSVDSQYAHKPGVIWHNGRLYHYYCGVSGKGESERRGIALAMSVPVQAKGVKASAGPTL